MENKNAKLLEEFNQMDRMPIFEINWAEYGSDTEDDWEIFYIAADINGLYCNDIKINWDDYLSLDEHLQLLFDAIIENKVIND